MTSKATLLFVTCITGAIARIIPSEHLLAMMVEQDFQADVIGQNVLEACSFLVDQTWSGRQVEDPAKILLSSDHEANETHIDVRWAHNSKTEYQNSSVSIFLSNDQNMTLRMDLAASSSNASFLWGPNGAWGYEDHPLDPNEDDFIGGAVESTVSDSLWHAQVKIPWDFLPPNVMRIQVLHSTSELDNYRILFIVDQPSQTIDTSEVNNWAQQFDSTCVVDPVYNAVISPIWKGLTVTAVIQTSALVIVAVVVSASSVVLIKSAIHGGLKKSSGRCCNCDDSCCCCKGHCCECEHEGKCCEKCCDKLC